MSMPFQSFDRHRHDDALMSDDLLPDVLYWCQHCRRTFLGCDAKPCRYFGGLQACAFEGCTASAEGLDIFPADDPYVTGEGAPDDPEERHAMREEILAIDPPDDPDELARFGGLRLRDLTELFERGLADPDERQGRAPSAVEFAAFLCRWPEVRLHGYVLPPTDDGVDGAVRIEGMECELPNVSDARRDALRGAFAAMAARADERIDDPDWLYASWD